ncbi:MAG: PAS domain S-box-containing protein [Phycisphaerales bacterium]|jgi:PAS domain S-box-containing protein
MTKHGTTILTLLYTVLLIVAAVSSHLIDQWLTRRDRADAVRLVESMGHTMSQQVELAIAAGQPGNAEQFIESIVAAQPRVAARLERPGLHNPAVYGQWSTSWDAIQTGLSLGGASDGPPVARLSLRIDPSPPYAPFRATLIALGLIAPIGAFSLASIHTRARHHRYASETHRVLQTRLDTLRESRGKELGEGTLDPSIEAQFDELAALVASMAAYKEFFTNALQSMVDSLLIVNAEGVMLAVNQAVVTALGYSEEELLGQNVSMIWADEKGLLLNVDRLGRFLSDGARNDLSLTFRTRSGNSIPVNLSGSAIRSRTGEVTGFVCIAVDVTDRKRAEKEKEKLNKDLVDISRRAGMAEVATGVLHNVGNVLNSVTVTASSISTMVAASRVGRLGQLATMIQTHKDDLGAFLSDDPKGRKIPGYLGSLADTLADEHETLLGEISELNKNIEHIKKVITVQQRVARVSGMTEPVDAGELLADAVRIRESSFEAHDIRLIKSYSLARSINTDKHRVLQILVNLVGNAADAMSSHHPEGGRSRRILSLRTIRCTDNPEFAEIEVSDTGPGIPEANLTKIFKHGFTTKKNGHGFGLHSAAISAKELGGSLTCRNRDVGTGATFTLRLPLDAREEPKDTPEIAA